MGDKTGNYISPAAEIAENVYIGRNVAMLGQVRIGRGTIIEDNCIVGKPSRLQLAKFKGLLRESSGNLGCADYDSVVDTPTDIGEDVQLHAGTIIYSGVRLGTGVICEDSSTVRWDTIVGDGTEIKNGGLVWSYVKIGQYCRVGGCCANDTYLGNHVSTFGNLVHAYIKYGGGRRDPAPRLENQVTVGFGAQIIGGVTVHENSYVASGSIVTKDVPPNNVVTNCNVHTPLVHWKGSLKRFYIESFPAEE